MATVTATVIFEVHVIKVYTEITCTWNQFEWSSGRQDMFQEMTNLSD